MATDADIMISPQEELSARADINTEDNAQDRLKRTASAALARLSDVERLVSDMLWECDPELTLTYASARSTHLLGCHPLALRGQSLLMIGEFQADFASEQRCGPPEQIARRVPFRDVPYLTRHRDGTSQFLLLSGLPVFDDETQEFAGYRGTARNVTAEVEARRQEVQARRQLINAIEAIDDGFALFNADETLVFANSRIRELSGSCSHLLTKPGTTLTELAYANANTEFAGAGSVEIDRKVTDRLRQTRAGNFTLERAEGNKWLRVTDKRTQAGDIVSIRTDITNLVERETALRVAKEDAELANRTKTEFLANISHELRTPLNAIIGFGEVIHDELFGAVGNPRYRQYISDILDSGRHLLGIINDILDVSKAEAGKLDLSEESVHVPKVVESAVRLVAERATQGEIKISRNLAPDLPALIADSRKIKQILLNLLSNAVKFTPPGGTVIVTAQLAENGDLIISTADTGIGMTNDEIALALTPFGQVDSALSRTHQGTGLGLPLCRALVKLHDGTLVIDSKPNAGTDIRVTFPAKRLEFG